MAIGRRNIKAGYDGLKQESGFTFVEFMITVALTLIVMGVVYGIFLTSLKIWKGNQDSVEQQAQARLALNKTSREIRQAYQVTTAEGNYLQFRMITTGYSDVTPDQSSVIKTMTITYSMTPDASHYRLYRTIETPGSSAATSMIANYLRNNNDPAGTNPWEKDLFHYYNSAGAELARPVASSGMIRTVRIGIVADLDPAALPSETHMATTIAIRAAELAGQ